MAGISGFESRRIETSAGSVHAVFGGDGPPLVLLHGFPQTHLMWAGVAPALANGRQVICFDLPGYGASDCPADIEAASKRTMAAQLVEAMGALGHERFDVAGHDRGGRVAYRMALDHPERVSRLAVLDILPTCEYWARMDHGFAMKIYHWPFLAQPEPLPETLIGGAPDYYIKHTLASWTAAKDLSAFAPDALEAYCAQARDPRRLKAMCDDYRAGEGVDVAHDEADRGVRKIACPTLAIWGGVGIAAGAEPGEVEAGSPSGSATTNDAATPLETWQDWCEDVRGTAIDAGHFIPEENPEATVSALSEFFA